MCSINPPNGSCSEVPVRIDAAVGSGSRGEIELRLHLCGGHAPHGACRVRSSADALSLT